MTKQFTWGRLLTLCCWLSVFLYAQPSSAAAPLCDERGASAIAATPVLPIRDVRLDASAPAPCESQGAAVKAAPSATRGAPALPDDDTRNGWLPFTAAPALARSASNMHPLEAGQRPPAFGYVPSVFRPPRA